MIQDTVVIGGECSLETRIDGDCDLTSMVEGDPDVLVVEGGGQTYPHYSGSYIVTPSTSQQVLETDGMVMDDDVTVNAVTQGSATTPATIINATPTITVNPSTGDISASVSATQQITPTVVEGYVSAGTAGNVGASGSAILSQTTQGATTYHPSSSDQSIASGKYLTGTQTIKAVTVSGLSADKILTGTTVKIGDADDDDRIANVVGTAQGGITPTGTKQISITQNGTTTEDVTNYANAEITVNVSGGSGGTTVASGTVTGQGTTTNNGCTEFAIGKKMPSKDYFLRVKVKSTSATYDRSTNYDYVWYMAVVDGSFGHYNCSSPGSNGNLPYVSDLSVVDNNSGTTTTKDAGKVTKTIGYMRNGSVTETFPNTFNPRRKTVNSVENFYFYIGNTNASYKWLATKTFDWEVVYYGSNPSTDIVEIS